MFEVEADIKDFGSQNVLCGGGRYNNLVETLDGPKTDGVGFAMGMERVMEAIASEDIHLDIVENVDCYIIPLSASENEYATKLCMDLRLNGFIVDMDYDNKNLKSNFKAATKKQAKYVIIVGEEENMAQNIIGERIAGLLREQGKTQRELAEQVGTTEVSMSRYIKGDRVPKGPILANIAKALHTTTDYLLGNEKDSNDPELEYNYTQRAIARNANRWSKKQKLDLVNALFENED